MMQSNESCLGEQFLRSYGEQEERENQTVKTKKAPPQGGAKLTSTTCILLIKKMILNILK